MSWTLPTSMKRSSQGGNSPYPKHLFCESDQSEDDSTHPNMSFSQSTVSPQSTAIPMFSQDSPNHSIPDIDLNVSFSESVPGSEIGKSSKIVNIYGDLPKTWMIDKSPAAEHINFLSMYSCLLSRPSNYLPISEYLYYRALSVIKYYRSENKFRFSPNKYGMIKHVVQFIIQSIWKKEKK